MIINHYHSLLLMVILMLNPSRGPEIMQQRLPTLQPRGALAWGFWRHRVFEEVVERPRAVSTATHG